MRGKREGGEREKPEFANRGWTQMNTDGMALSCQARALARIGNLLSTIFAACRVAAVCRIIQADCRSSSLLYAIAPDCLVLGLAEVSSIR